MKISYLLYLTVLLMFFSRYSLHAQEVTEDAPGQEPDIELTRNAETETIDMEHAASPEASTDNGEFEVFIPTDEISEDQSVAFPVDI